MGSARLSNDWIFDRRSGIDDVSNTFARCSGCLCRTRALPVCQAAPNGCYCKCSRRSLRTVSLALRPISNPSIRHDIHGTACPFPVSDSQQNINVLRGLAMQLQKIVNQENQKCWGKPLGSQNLWKGHVETIQRIQEMASQIQIKEVE